VAGGRRFGQAVPIGTEGESTAANASFDVPERTRPRGYWTGRVLAVISVPIVVATVWAAVVVVWTRTHQEVETRPAGGYPLTEWRRQTFPATPGRTAPRTVEVARMTLDQGGRQRSAIVSRPVDVAEGTRLPVVFYLHGLGGSSQWMFDEGGNGSAPAVFPSIAVFPDGVWNSWNAGGCCRPSTLLGTDDVAFLHALVSDMKSRPDVDPDRVFMFGVSNGGMMVYRYLCDHADELAGAMSVAGTNLSGCEPNAPIPVVDEHGTRDEVVDYDGNLTPLTFLFGPLDLPSARESIDAVASSMHCGRSIPGPSSSAYGFDVTSIDWPACDGGARVRFVTYHGMTHWWPVGPPWSTMKDAPEFFGLLPST
jgi:polyhydroxybutyrate depolymerase